ncbi:DHA2 family efflux MFS transporter permease subunit [Amycolatopsis sp. CA-230715]|uniref:DHA2 family efflux MFS transporter permease subunit n=1 Tax=Amycolatopsis sp. CA-230715 TaxID=2745196 RepID=UPI001C3294DE|nr:DHA2 family efflux MFS transporter permease subunit [Amycolatopsis sp. CA-230715]QWF79353.1 Multidrug resistance protein Stp [Amycolatopsis sp. CA-230715]
MTRPVNPWAALSALCLGFFMILLDTTIVMIAIPAMLRGLGAGLNAVVWVSSVYLLTYAVPMLFTSRLGDRFGPKRVFVAGLVVFTAASLWCGLAGTVEMLIAARAVQGLGAALMTPQTLAFIGHLFPPAKRGGAMGVWGAVAGVASITGPLLGGVLVDHLGWEWIFYVNVPIGVVTLVMTLVLVPDWQPKHAHSFDLLGIFLSAAGLFCVVFGIQNGQQYHWGTVAGGITVFELIGAGVVFLVAFVVWQRYNRKEPLIPLRVFGNRNFSAGTATGTALQFGLVGMFVPITIYIQSVVGLSPTMAGLLTAPMSLLSGVAAPLAGRLSDRMSAKYLMMGGLAAMAAGLGVLAWQAQPDTNPWALIPGLCVTGLGMGFIFAPMSNATMSGVDRPLAGAASGIYNTARQVGGVLGSAAMGVLLQAQIAGSLSSEAEKASSALPPEFRQQFVEGFAGASANEFGASAAPALPPGVPADVAARIGEVATNVVHNGLTDAAKTSLLLPIGVLLLGVVAAATMKRGTASGHVPRQTPAAEPAPVS